MGMGESAAGLRENVQQKRSGAHTFVTFRGPASWEGPADSPRLNPPPNRANERGNEGESLACPHRARGACQRSLVLMRAVLRGAARKESSDPSQLAGPRKATNVLVHTRNMAIRHVRDADYAVT